MASISEREKREIEAANACGDTPVVFVRGLWLLAGSWAGWADLFGRAGYAPVAPDWPGDPDAVGRARADRGVLAGKRLGQVAGHTAEVIGALDGRPAVVGHSTGGLVARMLAGRGLSAVAVAIDPGVFRGVLPLPASVLRRNRAVTEIVKMPGRGHCLMIDHGWREVARAALGFVTRFA